MAGRLEITGALSPWAHGLSTRLRARGYAEVSIYQIVRVAAELDAWMTQERVGVGGLTVDVLERFVLTRRARGAKAYITVRGLDPLIADLRAVGAAPPVILKLPSTPSELLLESYRRYLADERALRPRSILQCLVVAGQLLARLNGRPVGSLETADVRGFIDEQGRGWAPRTVQHLVWTVRSFLRFLFVAGEIDRPLATALLPRRAVRAAGLPEPASAATVAAIVCSCDTSSVAGRRDRAMLMLMARLGLRTGEVARLRLDDITWRSGEIEVAGKGGRVDRLPMPVDVGQAIVDYLHDGRPVVPWRNVFVALKAPFRALHPTAMNTIVSSACRRAGVEPVTPHQLRHSAATQMLAAGASLAEIGQVLRHHDESTTAGYAKVDYRRLTVIARPWPVTQ
jgi:integrase/recombinase XerD